MNAQNFYENMEKLSVYFGRSLTNEQRDIYFDELKYISSSAFEYAINNIRKTKKPTQANFPTIEEIQNLCPRKKELYRYNQDETEDQYYRRVKVTNLWKAYNILKNGGHDKFITFCTENNFSADDIDRVECKLKYTRDPKELIDNIIKKSTLKEKSDNREKLREQAKQLVEDDMPF